MLEKSVVEKCCKEVLERSVLQKCWRGVFYRSVGEEFGEEGWEKCCREMLEKRVVEMCGREVREKTVAEKCWRRVSYRSVGEECWQHWCKKMSGVKVLVFNFCWIPLLVETLQLHLCLGANYTCVYCILFRYSLHCSTLQSSRTCHLSNCLLCFRDTRRLVSDDANKVGICWSQQATPCDSKFQMMLKVST